MKTSTLTVIMVFIGAMAVLAHADEKRDSARASSDTALSEGAAIFNMNCAMCHTNGGNRFYPDLPLVGAPQLKNFNTFLDYIRHPTLPDGAMGQMPPIAQSRISDERAKILYRYITDELSPAAGNEQSNGNTRSHNGPAPGYGYGMGPGMMGRGYGMGPGMMGRGYGMGPGMMGGGMGPGMMGPGYGMGPGMMGPGYGPPSGYPGYEGRNYYQPEKPLDKKGARQTVQQYLDNLHNPNLELGKIEDKGSYFQVEIVTRKSGALVDEIIVNKKTGYMHSVY